MAPSASQLFAEISTPEPPAAPEVLMRRAVVLGGSMAGLMAARVLSDHAEEVVIVERDGTDVDAGPRPGVPQGSQVHALLPAGQVQLERWFPGFTDDAVAAGAPNPGRNDAKIFINDELRQAQDAPPEMPILITTRPFLEAQVRRKVLEIGNVRMVFGRAEGLRFGERGVTGARYVPAGGDEPVELDTDLVVDAMGRSSRLGDWLEEAGWPRAPMRRMPIKLNYASALFERDEAVSDTWVAISQTTPDKGRVARIGGINSVEGDRWIMLVAGYDDDRPTRDAGEFAARCRRHYPAMFGDIAERGRMIGNVITYHQADSRRRDFHELDRLPAGLVAAGDAVASFNPVYGQGMTSAILHASCLSAYLRGRPDLASEPAKAYFDRVRVIVDAAWQVSTFADLGLPHIVDGHPRGYKVIRWASNVILKASMTDSVTSQRLNRVTAMIGHPAELAKPSVLLRALRVNLFRGR
ncbi:FAD-dependent oxidoreductase [Dactylosporangium fulvum]|uniref:FAD-dependent monooxygenase n=1 Tax=Dactylosporangium fulvum TaxID=53359 RepID=A0ABY5W722_9ACTN|nr:FAD-dependent monooxygenase [Dactylosporangium fulvum]UWP84824.1 FAD-dependent monooxygenase [Dactylosporangium fulvum]